MAEEEVEEEQDEKGKGGSKKFPVIIVAVLIIVGLALAGGISYFITTQVMSSSSTDGISANHEPGVFYKLGDAKEGLIVNVGGIKSSRFLKIGLIYELNPKKEENLKEGKITEEANTKLMDTTLQILRTMKIEEFDANKEEEMKTKLKQEVNKVLGEGSVFDVYITSFMLQ